MDLDDYKDEIRRAAGISSYLMLLSPSLLCLKIWQKKSSKDVPFFPILELALRTVTILQHGLVMKINAVIVTYSIGLILNILCLVIYIYFTKDKSPAIKSTIKWSAVVFSMVAYANYEDKALVGERYGILFTLFTMILLVEHIIKIRKVIDNKNAQDLALPVVLGVGIATFIWTLYGITIKKPIMLIQTAPALCVSIIELFLIFFYPSKPSAKRKVK